jgi:endonuclease III
MKFPQIISALRKYYGSPKPPVARDPFAQIVWENIGYLVNDTRRKNAFDQLEKKIGLEPPAILAAPLSELTSITKVGGILEGLRAQRLKEIAHITLNEFEGDLSSILKLPLSQAMKALKQFPSISDPGAEKILLFAGVYPILALDSNGLRVLLRLGFGEEKKYYTATYKSVRAALKDEVGSDFDSLIAAYQLLRQHGQELCRRTNPMCAKCPVRKTCEYYRHLIQP